MRYPAINAKCPHLLHGADYNPDQWLRRPDILRDDLRLMRLAGCNVVSLGIFAWSALEPREGEFSFTWLDRIMDELYAHDVYAILATPSGARPFWLAQRYPEVLRVDVHGVRNWKGTRHNHCYTSPVYREKVAIINGKLTERYHDHPGLLLWHISNEYSGECYCELCQQAFRDWLRERYDNDLEQLNAAWYTAFWSHTYSDWAEIDAPSPRGEFAIHGLRLDWKRFVSRQTTDFLAHEIAAVRRCCPAIPVTTNFMATYPVINYWEVAPLLDVISWDCYPAWGQGNDIGEAAHIAFLHNLNRSLKDGQPFMLMESTPSVTNNDLYSRLKRPGLHQLASLQAVAHGSDTVQYFQWRKSQGAWEKFHGAVVDHVGHEHTRVFRDVAEVGQALSKLDALVGTDTPAEVAVLYDWENRWALESAKGPRNDDETQYEQTCILHSVPFWKRGIPFDVINMDGDFSRYRVLIAPMLYMVRPGVGERIERFVREGGTFIATYLSGWVNEMDLCFLGGFPGPLRTVLGIWSEEVDAIGPQEANTLRMVEGNSLGLHGDYPARIFCDLIHTEGAHTLAHYSADFYANRPALTVHSLGSGKAYYMATRSDARFLDDFYGALAHKLSLRRALETDLPAGVTAHYRTDGTRDFIFVMNFTDEARQVALPARATYSDLLNGATVTGTLDLPAYGVSVLT